MAMREMTWNDLMNMLGGSVPEQRCPRRETPEDYWQRVNRPMPEQPKKAEIPTELMNMLFGGKAEPARQPEPERMAVKPTIRQPEVDWKAKYDALLETAKKLNEENKALHSAIAQRDEKIAELRELRNKDAEARITLEQNNDALLNKIAEMTEALEAVSIEDAPITENFDGEFEVGGEPANDAEGTWYQSTSDEKVDNILADGIEILKNKRNAEMQIADNAKAINAYDEAMQVLMRCLATDEMWLKANAQQM